MTRRYRGYPSHRGELIDLETARGAVQQVAAERDALGQQLGRAQAAIQALQRRLDARQAEVDRLTHAVHALEARGARPVADDRVVQLTRSLQRTTTLLEDEKRGSERVREQARALEEQAVEAVAERDRVQASHRDLERELAGLRGAAADAGRAARLEADLANLRRHQADAIRRGVQQEGVRILTEVASIRDAVARALEAAPEATGPFHDGLRAILAKVDAVFAREGATLVGRVGEPFDPVVHEAVGTAEDGLQNTVHAVVSTGLLLADGAIALPARVVVGSG